MLASKVPRKLFQVRLTTVDICFALLSQALSGALVPSTTSSNQQTMSEVRPWPRELTIFGYGVSKPAKIETPRQHRDPDSRFLCLELGGATSHVNHHIDAWQNM
jgi:hypothetical protein